jgi:hypothetical protein
VEVVEQEVVLVAALVVVVVLEGVLVVDFKPKI